MPVQKPVVIVYAESTTFVDRDFFAGLDARVVVHQTASELLVHLRTTRPSALVLITSLQTYYSRVPWLREVERRSVFEGLRVIAILTSPMGGNSVLAKLLDTSTEIVSRVLLARALVFRDVFVCELPPYRSAFRKEMIARVALTLGGGQEFDPEEGSAVSVRAKRKVLMCLPGRISWISEEGQMRIECGARVLDGTECRVRLVNSAQESFALDVTSVGSSATNLRFNYGSEITFKIDASQQAAMNAFWANDSERSREAGKAVRRSLVVVKTAELRERVTSTLRSLHLEVRVPLLWRNVKNDVQRMSPDIVVIESSILQAAGAKSREFLQIVRAAAPASCVICVVGPGASAIVGGSNGYVVFEATSDIELALRNIAEADGVKPSESSQKRFWIGPEANFADCLLEIPDTLVSMSNLGVVVETSNTYRSLSQIFIEMPGGSYRILTKNLGSWTTADAWRADPSGGPVLSRFFFSLLHESRSFASDLRSVCDSISSARVAGVSLFGSSGKGVSTAVTQDEGYESTETLSSVSENAVAMLKQTGLGVDRTEWADKLKNMQPLSVVAHEEEIVQSEYLPPRRPKKKPYKISNQEWLFLAISLLVIALLVVAIIYMGDNTSDSQFSDSFEGLFKFYRK